MLGLASFLLGALVVLVLVDRVVAAQATARMDRMGTALAEMTASLGLPAVLQQDRIALGNLASRVTDFDEVIGCSLYTVDGRTLAFDGMEANDPDSKHYTAPIAVEETLAGYARVVLDRRQFRAAPGDLFLSTWPLVPGAMAVAAALLLFRLRRRSQAPAQSGVTEVGADMKFVLVANLFNQGSLRPLRAKTVLTHAMEQAVATALAHGGRAQPLPGARMLIAFDDDSATDRPFDVVCAALDFGEALAPSLPEADGPPAPSFRFGLHLCEASADEASVLESAPGVGRGTAVRPGAGRTARDQPGCLRADRTRGPSRPGHAFGALPGGPDGNDPRALQDRERRRGGRCTGQSTKPPYTVGPESRKCPI